MDSLNWIKAKTALQNTENMFPFSLQQAPLAFCASWNFWTFLFLYYIMICYQLLILLWLLCMWLSRRPTEQEDSLSQQQQKKTLYEVLHFSHRHLSTMWDSEKGDGYLGLHVARSSCGLCSPCTSPGCGRRRAISESPWLRRRPLPERMRTAASCCSGRHVSPPALCNSQSANCSLPCWQTWANKINTLWSAAATT